MGSKTATKGKTTAATKTTTTKSKPSAKRPARTRPGDARAKPGKASPKPSKAASKAASKPEPSDLAAIRRRFRRALSDHALAVIDQIHDFYATVPGRVLTAADLRDLIGIIRLAEGAFAAAEAAKLDALAEREEAAATQTDGG